jgi:hypothetical protein
MIRPVKAARTPSGVALTISADAMTDLLLALAEHWPDVELFLADAHSFLGHAASCRWADEPKARERMKHAEDAARAALDAAGWSGGYRIETDRYEAQELASDLLAALLPSVRGGHVTAFPAVDVELRARTAAPVGHLPGDPS